MLQAQQAMVPANRSALLPVGPSIEDQALAQQKAHFVGEAWRLARLQKIPLKTACSLAAARAQDDFPALLAAGKGGTSLLGETNAWPNYRAWSRAMGTVKGSRQPDTANWETLLPRYRGARSYDRPGAPEFWTILANLYEHPNKLALRYAYNLATVAWKRSAGGEIPSYAQVYHWYQSKADQKAIMIARHGEEWYRNNVAGFITRRAPRVDECWVGDHHIFDAPVRVFNQERGQWVPVRPWITAWLDWGSLFFVGYLIRPIDPNRDSIERALRDGIVRNGYRPPLHLYIDNGRDYKAALGPKPLTDAEIEQVRGIGAALNCRVHFAIPYNARAKIVERMFKEICMRFSKLWKGYRGSNPVERPETADEEWNNPERLPTLDQFQAAFDQWLAAVYHSAAGNGRTLAGKSPLEARAAAQPLRPPLEAGLVYKAFLRDVGIREIGRGGTVKALNRLYRSDNLWKLFGRSEAVRVRVDPDNVDRVWIYTADGREIGPADAIPELPALADGLDGAPDTIEQVREEMKRQRRQIREAKQASAANRDMDRFTLTAGRTAAESVFNLPPAAAAEAPRAIQAAPAEDAVSGFDVDPDLIADLEAAVQEQTARNKDYLGDFDL